MRLWRAASKACIGNRILPSAMETTMRISIYVFTLLISSAWVIEAMAKPVQMG